MTLRFSRTLIRLPQLINTFKYYMNVIPRSGRPSIDQSPISQGPVSQTSAPQVNVDVSHVNPGKV